MRFFSLLFSFLLDALLPPHEDVRAARALSPQELAALVSPREAGAPWISALFPYRDERVRALVRAVKYRGETSVLSAVGPLLGDYLAGLIAEKRLMEGWERPLLVPVPVSKERARSRGYNQAERILRAALPRLGSEGELALGALMRAERESQVSVGRAKRAENVRGAFFVPDARAVTERFVILVDDVVETGSTFADARRALLASGAKDVAAVALAH